MSVAQMTDLAGIECQQTVPVVGKQEIVSGSMVFVKLLQHLISTVIQVQLTRPSCRRGT